jgi:hypothetical protein
MPEALRISIVPSAVRPRQAGRQAGRCFPIFLRFAPRRHAGGCHVHNPGRCVTPDGQLLLPSPGRRARALLWRTGLRSARTWLSSWTSGTLASSAIDWSPRTCFPVCRRRGPGRIARGTPGHRERIRRDGRTFYRECPDCRTRTAFFVESASLARTRSTSSRFPPVKPQRWSSK